MSDTATPAAPAPVEVGPEGVQLDVVGTDANEQVSTVGINSPSLRIDDPNGAFTFTSAADMLSATAVPTGKAGSATVSFGGSGTEGPLSASWVGDVPPGPVTSVTIVSTPIVAPPAPEPAPAAELFTFSGDPATIDATQWPVATVETDTGLPLYSWAGTGDAPVGTDWAVWTGATQPVPPAA